MIESLRDLFPHLDETERAAAQDRLRRYLQIAVEITMRDETADKAVLTEPDGRGSVNAGQVDPSTFINTG